MHPDHHWQLQTLATESLKESAMSALQTLHLEHQARDRFDWLAGERVIPVLANDMPDHPTL